MIKYIKKVKCSAYEKGIHGFFGIVLFTIKYFFCSYLLCEVASHAPNIFVPAIHKIRGVNVGKDVFIDRSVYIDNLYPELITLEDGVRLTAHSVLVCHFSAGNEMKKCYFPFKKQEIVIKRHAFVGVNATILPGVTINEFSIVGAGSVVTKDVPAFTFVAGNPAKTIKKIKATS